MGKKPTDRFWIGSLILLLAVEIVLLGMHFLWDGFLPKNNSSQRTPVAGSVLENLNDLHRRGLNSLIWEKSTSNDTLYFYDSILTLSQSSAVLKLFKDTQIHLSENTLMTIEPADQKQYGEITLKIHKGGLKARNPFAQAQLESADWKMSIQKGSEIDLRQTNDGEYELNVKKGEVRFNNSNNKESVGPNQVLRIAQQKIERFEVAEDSDLKWLNPPPSKIYSHSPITEATVSWINPNSETLVIQSLGKPETILKLGSQQTSANLKFEYGQHRLFLRRGTFSSLPLEIEVQTAPVVHLLSPLPRHRGQIAQPIEFRWTNLAEATKYELKVTEGKRLLVDQTIESQQSFSKTFFDEVDSEWSVWAIDSSGFKIPPPYSYPLFIREEPLAAPKLHSPTLRSPANKTPKNNSPKGASFWWRIKMILIPEAIAEELLETSDDLYEVEMKWESVPKADHYVIEISKTSDFRNPVVTQKTIKPKFIWNQVQLSTYYWRVAAGSRNGRLGFFSEPETINLRDNTLKNVTVRSLPKTLPQVQAVPLETPPKDPGIQMAPSSEISPKTKEALRLEWRPFSHYQEFKANPQVKAKLSGINFLSLGASTNQKYYDSHTVRAEFLFSRFDLKPSPRAAYPFQKTLSWNEYSATLALFKKDQPLGYSVMIKHSIYLQRTDLESIEAKDSYLIGPGATLDHQTHIGNFITSVHAIVGTQYGILLSEQWRLQTKSQFFWGLGLEINGLQKGTDSNFGAKLNLSLGLGF